MDEGTFRRCLDDVEDPTTHSKEAEGDAVDAPGTPHVACPPPTHAEALEGVVAQYDLIFSLTKELEDANAAIFRAEEDIIRLQLDAEERPTNEEADRANVDDEATTINQASENDATAHEREEERQDRFESAKEVQERVTIRQEAVEAATNRREKLALQKRILALEQQLEKESRAHEAREDVREKLITVRGRLFEKSKSAANATSVAASSSQPWSESDDVRSIVGPLEHILGEMCAGWSNVPESLLRCMELLQQREIGPTDAMRLEEMLVHIRTLVVKHVNPLVQQLQRSETAVRDFVQQVGILQNTMSTYVSKLDNHTRQVSEYHGLVVQDEAAIDAIRTELGEKAVLLDKTTDQLHKLHKFARAIGRQNSVKMREINSLKRQLSVLHDSHRKKQRAVHAVEGGLGDIVDGIAHCKGQLQRFEDDNGTMSGELAGEEEKLQEAMLNRKCLEGELVDMDQSYHHIIHSIRQYEGQLQQMIVQQQQSIEEIKPLTNTLKDNEKQYSVCVKERDILYKQETESLHKLCSLKKFLQGKYTLVKQHRHLMLEQIQEETKMQFLTNELGIPMNMHHWRKLERNDPETYKLLQKSIGMQRQLVRKTSELAEQERHFDEKESRLFKLQSLLASQVTPDYEQEMSVLLIQLEEKAKELQDLTEEVQHLRNQAEESAKKIRIFIDNMTKDCA
eukprot:scaffold285_cov330-Pavlova_lutheri.AAC.54